MIGTQIFPTEQTRADWEQLLRTTGFCASPGMLRILGILPGLAGVVFLVGSIWMLATFVLAVRPALDYTSVWRAIGVCGTGWLSYMFQFFLLDRFLLYQITIPCSDAKGFLVSTVSPDSASYGLKPRGFHPPRRGH